MSETDSRALFAHLWGNLIPEPGPRRQPRARSAKTMTDDRKTIMDIAEAALADPASTKPQDVSRIAAFVLDHPEHIAFHRRVGAAFMPSGPLGRRMQGIEAQAQKQTATLPQSGDPTVQHPEPVVDPALAPLDHADADEHPAT